MDISILIILIAVGLFIGREVLEKLDWPKSKERRQTPKQRQPVDQVDHDDSEIALRQKLIDFKIRQNDEWAREAGLAMDPEEFADRQIAQMAATEGNHSNYQYQPPIILLPESRTKVDIAIDGNSWFGGLPCLGDQMWPRSRDGSLMHPAAQIDLADLAALNTPVGLPKSGSLAFFVDLTTWPYDGAVVYVSQPGEQTQPISQLPRLFQSDDGYEYGIDGYTKENAPRMFPRWPISFVPISGVAHDKEERDKLEDFMVRAYPSSNEDFFLTTRYYERIAPELVFPIKWNTAHRFADLLTNSRSQILRSIKFCRDGIDNAHVSAERRRHLEENLAFMTPNIENFVALEQEVVAWAYAHNQWAQMQDGDETQLKDYISVVHKPLGDETSGLHLFMRSNPYLQSFADQTLEAMVHGPDKIFNQLPQRFRDDFDRKGRFAEYGNWHQMFGISNTTYGDENHDGEDYLLLKLGRDSAQNWKWGEGSACFWISPDDLENHRWKNAKVVIGQQ